jgi:hypothetical protein
VDVLVYLVLAGNGIAAGVFAGTLLGGVPLLLALPPDRYVHAHGYLATRYDPFMPVTLATSAMLDMSLAIILDSAISRALFGLAGAFLVSVMVVSVTKTVPINKWVVTLDPARLPSDWAARDPRRRWRTWNLTRSCLAVAALAVNLVAAASN